MGCSLLRGASSPRLRQAGPGPSPHPGQAREGLQTVPSEMEKPLRIQNRTQGTAYSKEGKEEKKRRGEEESSLQNLRRLCQTALSGPVVTQHSSLDVTTQTQEKSAFFYLPLHFVHYIPPPCLCMFLSPIVWYTDPHPVQLGASLPALTHPGSAVPLLCCKAGPHHQQHCHQRTLSQTLGRGPRRQKQKLKETS